MFILEFFRDFFSGIMYWLYLVILIFAFFYVLGIVADRKRLAIAAKLKEKKKYDIESGREAAIAAMESKQVLDVEETPQTSTTPVENKNLTNQNTFEQAVPAISQEKKEEVPTVMVLNSQDTQESSSTPKQSEPLVISSTPTDSTVQNTNNQ